MSKNKNAFLENFSQLINNLKGYTESKEYKSYERCMKKFHSYSINNILMITMQRPDATLVAGNTTWRQLNRTVKDGERGIKIVAPCGGGFRCVEVYDITQTEGENLPNINMECLIGGFDRIDRFVEALKKTAQMEIRFESLPEDTRGYCDLWKNEIVLRDGMSEWQTAKTLFHEVAHAILHSKNAVDTQIREIEAESAAYLVCSAFGICSDKYSLPYLVAWANGDVNLIESRKENIFNAAAKMYDACKNLA